MQQLLPRLCSALLLFCALSLSASAQDTTRPTSVDPDLLSLESARLPKEYTISSIKITGLNYLDQEIVASISGLQVGDKIMIPGGDAFTKAINNLWRQRFFGNVQIFITAVQGDYIDIELNVQERPTLGNFSFVGPKKAEKEELPLFSAVCFASMNDIKRSTR